MKSSVEERSPPKAHGYLNLGSPCNAISASPDWSKLIVAGRDIVKIISLENTEQPKVLINLRAGKTQSLNYTGNDCCWHPSQVENYKALISTAATNGAVVVWNITSEGARSVEKVWTDHNRAVNKLAWHPEKSEYLLTGSQDTTLKLSDIREANPCKITFQPKSEAIRDVQFHPFNPVQFAAAFDNGTVQLWDIRKHTQAVEKITAHQGLVLSIEWHPEEKNIIASGGRDRAIRVWDITSGKPLHNISTISSVSRIKWRPGHKWQIASCSSIVDLQTHIWDVKRPYIPLASFTEHRDVPTGIIWRDSQTLISCSKDNYLLINNINDAYQPYHHIRTTGIAWNVNNDLVNINDKINRNQNNEMIQLSTQFPSFFATFNVPTPIPQPSQTSNKEKGVLYIHSPLGYVKGGEKLENVSFLFEYFAKNYKFKDLPFEDLCSHNELIALNAKQFHISKIWSLLKLYYGEKAREIQEKTKREAEEELIKKEYLQEQDRIKKQLHIDEKSLSSQQLNNNNNSSNEDQSKQQQQQQQDINQNDKKVKDEKKGKQQQQQEQEITMIDERSPSPSNTTPIGIDQHADIFAESDDPIFNILSSEAVTPLSPLPSMLGNKSNQTKSSSSSSSSNSHHRNRTIDRTDSIEENEVDDDLNNNSQKQKQQQNNSLPSESTTDRNGQSLLDKILYNNQQQQQNGKSVDRTTITTKNAINNQNNNNNINNSIQEFNIEPILISMLEYCVERGDIQTCVYTVLVLKDIHPLVIGNDRSRVSKWLSSYIELLHRQKLWTSANEIMKSADDPFISHLSQRSTSVLVSCSCGKTLPPSVMICDKCGSIPSECSICRLPVKGSYVWCQGCGHGGHLLHMNDWFKDHETCPTGCSHVCRPKKKSL